MKPGLSLRPPDGDDLGGIVRVFAEQDRGWWNEVDGDSDDVRSELERAVAAKGSLADGARVCCDGSTIVGVGLHVGHGQTNVAVDPTSTVAKTSLELLVDWLLDTGGDELDAPIQDRSRLEVIESRGLHPIRSSFELERCGPLDDLGPTEWPDGLTPSSFCVETEANEVHDLVYSVWTDVDGHTYRAIDEWRRLFLSGPSFDPELVVVARRGEPRGAVAGVALSRIFNNEIGWVSQLAVGRDHRGLGLGRSLLVESLRRLATRGVDRFGLGVEAENATALGLYRSVGLEIARQWVHCSRPPVG